MILPQLQGPCQVMTPNLCYVFAKEYSLGIQALIAVKPVVSQIVVALPSFSQLGAKININLNKFILPTSTIMPEPSLLWKVALSEVSADWKKC